MPFILKLFLFVLLGFIPTISSAIVRPTHHVVKNRKLRLKDKAALWLIKRKLKKNVKRTSFEYIQDTTGCTTILLKTGDSLKVKLLKTTKNEVIFKRCGHRKSEISISKADIHQIVLSGGLVIFDSQKNTSKSPNNRTSKSNYGYAILATLTGLFALMLVAFSSAIALIFGLIAILLAFKSAKRHRKLN